MRILFVNSYWNDCSMEDLNAVLPEGLPSGMVKEFEESKRNALLIRQSFLDLRDNFRRIVDPPLQSSDGKGRAFTLCCVYFSEIQCEWLCIVCFTLHIN